MRADFQTPVTRVLLIEDDEDDYVLTRDLLDDIEGSRFHVEWCRDYEAGLDRMLRNEHDVCLVDYRLGKQTGLDLLRAAVNAGSSVAVIFLTGQSDRAIDQEAIRAGASDYLVKQKINPDVLDRCIRYAIDRKQTEQVLRAERNFVAAVVDTAGALVVVLDRQGRIVRFNRACELVSGYSFQEVRGMKWWEVFLPPDQEKTARRDFAAIRCSDASRRDYEQRWMVRGGRWRDFAWSHNVLRNANGDVEFVVGTGVDITERRDVENKLRESEEALTKAREREVEVGTRIQQTLLVRQVPTHIPGVSIGARSLASQRIDGDFWDFFVYDRQRFDVLVGDVMGKGVPAALLAAASKSHFQHAVRRLGLSLHEYGRLPEPAEIVGAVHSLVTKELVGLDTFVTLCYAGFDLDRMRLEFVDGGHTRTIHYRRSSGDCELLEGNNLPLGVDEWEVYQQKSISFSAGDVFFFYSDGVTEARTEDGALFGVERLVDLVKGISHLDAWEIVERIYSTVTGLTAAAGVVDDLTCVAIKISEVQSERPLSHATMEVLSDPAELASIRKFVHHFCSDPTRPMLDEDGTNALVLATSEAVSNIIQHSYDGSKDRRIQIEAEAFLGRVSLTLCDWGRPFERDGVTSPAFDGSRESGFGLYIIENSVDEARYYQDEIGRNCLTLTKRTVEGVRGGHQTGLHDQ
jgi:sigma-B regulation protein RsbU (phosphoserine phosphatase)